MKKFLLSFLFLLLGLSISAQDTVYLNGTAKVSFKLNTSIYYYFPNCTQNFVAGTSIRTITGMGKLQIYQSGQGYIIPYQKYVDAGGSTFVYYYKNGCRFDTGTITFKNKISNTDPDPIPVPDPPLSSSPSNTSGPCFTSSSYDWSRTIGNTSAVQYGPELIKALRTPTGIADLNGELVISSGLVEGNSGIFIVKNNKMYEIGKPRDGDITLNVTAITSYDGILYCVGFDSYGAISSALVAYKDGQEVVFQYGKAFKCKWQDNAYKSGIHVNTAKITGVDADATTLYVYCGTTCYTYDRITGQSKGTVTVSIPTSIAKAVSGGNVIEMTSTSVTYNGKTFCTTPSGPKITNYNFIPKDFNTYERKGSVCFGTNSIWVTDAGNCRVLHYDLTGKYLGQVAYMPMNYNCAVDRNNPSRVFAKELEFKVTYPDMKWELVANWGYGYGSTYQYAGDNLVKYFFKDAVTTTGGTFAIVRTNSGHDVVKLTETGIVKVSSHQGYISLTMDAKVIYMSRANGKANFYLDGALKESVSITSESALNGNGYIGYTADGSFVVCNDDKNHNGYHLTWVKGGLIKNAMPSRNFTEAQSRTVPFAYGDFFATGFYPVKSDGQREGYAGSNQLYVVGNKVFYNYLGEFFGNDGGQTNLWYMYENGVFIKRVGMTVYESYALDGNDAPRMQAGNSWGGGVVLVNGIYYIHTNCEHTGAVQTFHVK